MVIYVDILSKAMRLVVSVISMGKKENTFMVLLGKHEGKRKLGGPIRKWEDNTKMELKEITLECLDWFLVQDRKRWRMF